MFSIKNTFEVIYINKNWEKQMFSYREMVSVYSTFTQTGIKLNFYERFISIIQSLCL